MSEAIQTHSEFSTKDKASVAFKFAIAVIGTAGLLAQAGVFSGHLDEHFFFMFTHISNIAVVAYFWCAGICAAKDPTRARRPLAPKLKHALTLAIMVTCLVAAFILPNFGLVFVDGKFYWTMLVLHFLVPLGTVADWIAFDQKGLMAKTEPPAWLLFPLAYFAYIVVAVECFGVWARTDSRWPYAFIDFDANGIPATCAVIAGLIVFFLLFGYAMTWVDHRLAKRQS